MQISTQSNTKSYQNKDDNSNLIIKIDDIVKAKRKHYIIDSINNTALTGTDMYGNKLDFFIDDVESIIFDSSKQSNIFDYIKDNQLETLKSSLLEITNKLNNPITQLKHIKHLKNMKQKILKQINVLELEKIEIA
ncbi:MAG: hypothetical protein C0625_08450 [Arcobacter sp.]|nr:MAG: hypothetical protein C0625_08450 [Arcobacter sp.]